MDRLMWLVVIFAARALQELVTLLCPFPLDYGRITARLIARDVETDQRFFPLLALL